MSAARLAGGLIAAVVALASTSARAMEHDTADVVHDDAFVSLDFGGGMIQPNLAQSTFTVLDTWNGQHTYYHATGASLGVARPFGWMLNATAHLYPFSFRGLGLVTTAEFGGFTSNMTSGNSAFGAIDTTNNSYWSVLAGPEAQFRLASFFARAGVLGGGRYSQVGDFTAIEWRIAVRGQLDWIIGNEKRGSTALTIGVFGGADLVPSFGWSSGLSMSVAFL